MRLLLLTLFSIILPLFQMTEAFAQQKSVPQIWIDNASIFKSLVETGFSGSASYLKITGDGDCQGMSIGKNQVTVASGSLWIELFSKLSPIRRNEILSKLDQPYQGSFRKILNELRDGRTTEALIESRKILWQNRKFGQDDQRSCSTNSGRPGIALNAGAKEQLHRILVESDIQNQQRIGEVSAAKHAFRLSQLWRWKQSPLRFNGTNTACSRIEQCADQVAIRQTMPNFREFLWFFDRTVNSRAYLDLIQDPIKAVPWERSGVKRAERMMRLALGVLRSCPTWQPTKNSEPKPLCDRYRAQYTQAKKNTVVWAEKLNNGKLNENQIRLFNFAYIRSQFGSPVSFWLSMNRRGTIAVGKGCASQMMFDLTKIIESNGYGDGNAEIIVSRSGCE